MSTTPVPISIRLVRAAMAASSGKGEACWRGKVVHAEVGAVHAGFLRGHGQVDALQQALRCGGDGQTPTAGAPVAEREKT